MRRSNLANQKAAKLISEQKWRGARKSNKVEKLIFVLNIDTLSL